MGSHHSGPLRRFRSTRARQEEARAVRDAREAIDWTKVVVREKEVELGQLKKEYSEALRLKRENARQYHLLDNRLSPHVFLDLPHLFHGYLHFVLSEDYLYIRDSRLAVEDIYHVTKCGHQDLSLRRTSLFWIEEYDMLVALCPKDTHIVVRKFLFNEFMFLQPEERCCERVCHTLDSHGDALRICVDKEDSDNKSAFIARVYSHHTREEALLVVLDAENELPTTVFSLPFPFPPPPKDSHVLSFFARHGESWMLAFPHAQPDKRTEPRVMLIRVDTNKKVDHIGGFTAEYYVDNPDEAERALAFLQSLLFRTTFGQVPDVWITELNEGRSNSDITLLISTVSFAFLLHFKDILPDGNPVGAPSFVCGIECAPLVTWGSQHLFLNEKTKCVTVVQFSDSPHPERNTAYWLSAMKATGLVYGVKIREVVFPSILIGKMSSETPKRKELAKKLENFHSKYAYWKDPIEKTIAARTSCLYQFERVNTLIMTENYSRLRGETARLRELCEHFITRIEVLTSYSLHIRNRIPGAGLRLLTPIEENPEYSDATVTGD